VDKLISVIIPAYNAEDTLQESIDSVLNQTYEHIEIIIVDDGSSDSTANIAREYTMKDNRCRYIYQNNTGQPAALNHGIEHANGEYISFLDADDIYETNKIDLQFKAVEKKPESIVLTQIKRFMVVDSKRGYLNTTILPTFTNKKEYTKTLLNLSGFQMALFSTALVQKSSLERVGFFDTNLPTAKDWDLWLRLSLHNSFHNIQEPLYLYRKYPGSLSLRHGFHKTLSTHIQILDKFKSIGQIKESEISFAKTNRYIEHTESLIYKKEYANAMRVLMQGCSTVPMYFYKDFYRLIYSIFKGVLFNFYK
jgi:glycosyltransferase involved in cell wall biosynthesis